MDRLRISIDIAARIVEDYVRVTRTRNRLTRVINKECGSTIPIVILTDIRIFSVQPGYGKHNQHIDLDSDYIVEIAYSDANGQRPEYYALYGVLGNQISFWED